MSADPSAADVPRPVKTGALAFLLDAAPPSWGTREEFHCRLSRALCARGVQPILVYQALPADIRERLEATGAVVKTIGHLDINHVAGARRFYNDLGRLIREYRVDTVHIRFFLYYSALQWMARLHGVDRIIYTEATSVLLRARVLKRMVLKLRTRIVTYPFNRVIAISEYAKRILVLAGMPEQKIDVVYNGVDTERFAPDPRARERVEKQYGIGSDDIIVSTVAALLPVKKLHVIVEACSLLQRRGLPVRLLVAGDGHLAEELQELSHRLGIADRTHWLGYVPDPTTLLQASDVFVLASVEEAFGNVLAEAMACGIPVVGSRSGGIPEVVEDGTTGLLADPEDPASFADAIERLARDKPLRVQMGRQGRIRVVERFSVDKAVSETLCVYKALGCTAGRNDGWWFSKQRPVSGPASL
jgi:glycosyltransferase involved in cell wall biosynthesis